MKWGREAEKLSEFGVFVLALQEHSALVSHVCVQWQWIDSLILGTVEMFMQQK